MCQARVVWMKGQRNECLKAAGLVLQLAQPQQMVDAVIGVLDVSIQHRAIGPEAQAMRSAMDVEPLAGVRLVLANLAADLRMENLGPAARHAPQPRFDQVFE